MSEQAKPSFEQLLEGAKIEVARGRGAVNCTYTLAAKGRPYPRTCKRCGLGPCAFTNYLLAAAAESPKDPPNPDPQTATPAGELVVEALTKWKALPDDERNGERPFVMGFNEGWVSALATLAAADHCDDAHLLDSFYVAIPEKFGTELSGRRGSVAAANPLSEDDICWLRGIKAAIGLAHAKEQAAGSYWLIERRCSPPQYSADGCPFFVNDPMHARRFPNEEAATAAFRRWHQSDRADCFVSEHVDVTMPSLAKEQAAGVDLPNTCDGIEQDAFEAWAASERFVMDTHPLHWLFLNAETNAARKGWKAGLLHCRERIAALAAPASSVPDRAQLVEALGDAADLLKRYAAFIHTVRADDLELHPYLPEVERVAEECQALSAANGEGSDDQ